MKCNHYGCRCARARELALISDRTGDPRLMFEAANLGEVECRMEYTDTSQWQLTEEGERLLRSVQPQHSESK